MTMAVTRASSESLEINQQATQKPHTNFKRPSKHPPLGDLYFFIWGVCYRRLTVFWTSVSTSLQL